MTRILELSGPLGATRFHLLWAAMTGSADGKGERTPAMFRKEARLQGLLETISDRVPGPSNVPEMRTLRAEGGSLTIPQEDFDLLQQYMEKTQWNLHVSRAVVDTLDWLSAAEKKDGYEAAEPAAPRRVGRVS
jgi:hypothetical protein